MQTLQTRSDKNNNGSDIQIPNHNLRLQFSQKGNDHARFKALNEKKKSFAAKDSGKRKLWEEKKSIHVQETEGYYSF